MFWVTGKRIIKTGLLNFWRNGFVSLSSVWVMTTTLLVIAGLLFMIALLGVTLDQIRDRVDINVYFLPEALDEDIEALRRSIESLPEVAHVDFITRDEALENFRERHANDEITLQALDELGDNPLGAVINIRAKETSQYEGIANFLESDQVLGSDGSPIIDDVNYQQNKVAIDRLTNIIDSTEAVGFAISLVFVVMSVLITFNTIRLAIYVSREEISVMRLVGASNYYVRSPFVVTGILYGLISGILTLVLLYPISYWLGPKSENFFTGLNLFTYYTENFGQIFFIILGSGVLLGAVSSYMAVHRYLKV